MDNARTSRTSTISDAGGSDDIIPVEARIGAGGTDDIPPVEARAGANGENIRSNRRRNVNNTPPLAPLHNNCNEKVKKLSYTLRSLSKNLPNHATTILFGDSLTKGVDKRKLDNNSDSIRIRSVGGLCVVATVQALLQHRQTLPKIKRVVYSLGINDYLHRGNHCYEETARYFKALEVESARVFPNAVLNFVLPFKGMVGQGVTDMVQSDLQKLLKENCPKIRYYTPPNLSGKVNSDGIHPNKEGNWALTKFYGNKFVPPKPQVFNRNSGRRSQAGTFATAHLPPGNRKPPVDAAISVTPENFRVPSAHPPPATNQQCYPAQGGLAKEIVSAFTQVLQVWGHQPPPISRYNAPWL